MGGFDASLKGGSDAKNLGGSDAALMFDFDASVGLQLLSDLASANAFLTNSEIVRVSIS